MFRILRATSSVCEVVLKAEQMVDKVRIHKGAEAELVDDPDGHILSLASNYGGIIARLIQKNTCHTHLLPQAHTLFQLFGRKRYFFALAELDFTQADIAEKTRPRPAISDGRDYP